MDHAWRGLRGVFSELSGPGIVIRRLVDVLRQRPKVRSAQNLRVLATGHAARSHPATNFRDFLNRTELDVPDLLALVGSGFLAVSIFDPAKNMSAAALSLLIATLRGRVALLSTGLTLVWEMLWILLSVGLSRLAPMSFHGPLPPLLLPLLATLPFPHGVTYGMDFSPLSVVVVLHGVRNLADFHRVRQTPHPFDVVSDGRLDLRICVVLARVEPRAPPPIDTANFHHGSPWGQDAESVDDRNGATAPCMVALEQAEHVPSQRASDVRPIGDAYDAVAHADIGAVASGRHRRRLPHRLWVSEEGPLQAVASAGLGDQGPEEAYRNCAVRCVAQAPLGRRQKPPPHQAPNERTRRQRPRSEVGRAALPDFAARMWSGCLVAGLRADVGQRKRQVDDGGACRPVRSSSRHTLFPPLKEEPIVIDVALGWLLDITQESNMVARRCCIEVLDEPPPCL